MADAIWNNNYLLSNMDAQKLYAQSPLTTGVSGSSAYIGIEPSARYNETVLYSGHYIANTGTYFTVSEDITNFDKIEFTFNRNPDTFAYCTETFVPSANTFVLHSVTMNANATSINLYATRLDYTSADLKFTTNTQIVKVITTSISENTASPMTIKKVIGINRKEV